MWVRFTFHYGPIQMEKLKSYNPTYITFTFHYGPIQIQKIIYVHRLKKIYIPLWSYSNETEKAVYAMLNLFTFHYGPIQIGEIDKCHCFACGIYIPLWSYSNPKRFICDRLSKDIYIPLWSYSNG